MRTATFPEASPLLRESWLWPSHPLALRLDCPAPSPPCPFWKLRPPPELRYFVPHTALHAFLPQPQRLFLPITSKGLPSLPLSPKGPTISPLQLPNLSLTPSALAVSSSRPLARLDALAPLPSLAPAQRGPAPRSPDCARRSAHRAACAGGGRLADSGRSGCHRHRHRHFTGTPKSRRAAEVAGASAPTGWRCGRTRLPHLTRACDLTQPGLCSLDQLVGLISTLPFLHSGPRFFPSSYALPALLAALFIRWCAVPPHLILFQFYLLSILWIPLAPPPPFF